MIASANPRMPCREPQSPWKRWAEVRPLLLKFREGRPREWLAVTPQRPGRAR
jgi:hypothetical protein